MNKSSESVPDTAGIADRIHSNVSWSPLGYTGGQRSLNQSRWRIEERTSTLKVNPTFHLPLLHSGVPP